jgi:hypothetical protein
MLRPITVAEMGAAMDGKSCKKRGASFDEAVEYSPEPRYIPPPKSDARCCEEICTAGSVSLRSISIISSIINQNTKHQTTQDNK